jgi:hypothetical protein
MKYKIALTSLASLFGVALGVSMSTLALADDHECSLARAAGHWSLTDNGTVIGIGPRTAVGVFKLDGNGNLLNGVAASSLNGSVASETFSGTYTVNADCSGSFDVKIYSGATELFELTAFTAFDDDMKEMRAVINLQARKQ